MTQQTKTLVIFRMLQGQVLALFPLIPATNDGWNCMSYAHVGQHGAADVGLTAKARLATKAEYAPLARELRQLGYKLRIGSRVPRNAYAIRKASV